MSNNLRVAGSSFVRFVLGCVSARNVRRICCEGEVQGCIKNRAPA